MSNTILMKTMFGIKRLILVGDHLEVRNNCQFMSCVLVEIGMEKLTRNIILMQTTKKYHLKIRIRRPIRINKSHQIEKIPESLEEGQTGDQIAIPIQSLKIRMFFIIMEIDRGKLILLRPKLQPKPYFSPNLNG